MNFLLDTHVLLWAISAPERLPESLRTDLDKRSNAVHFSAASIWEIAIKNGLGRADFQVDASAVRRGLLENGFDELAITGAHAAAVANLPDLHRDPFDRILVAQSQTEALTLLTRDATVAGYPGPIRLI